jgi:hypothetical protein
MGGRGGYGRDERVYGKDEWEGEGRMYAFSCEGNAHIPQTVVGRKRPLFASLYSASLQCCIDDMFVSHTQCDTTRPRPTCEIRPTGMSLLEGEGRPSQATRWVAPRRREPLCARAREVRRRVAANRLTQHAVKSCVPRRAVSSRLPMPPPPRFYP